MANEKNLMAFRGGEKGFVGNYYAVWQRKLDGDDPNPWAVRAGVRTSVSALRSHSNHGNAIYKQLLDFLWKIQRQEENKERDWIIKKNQQIAGFGMESDYQKQIQRAIDNREYGLAYTLLTQFNKDLKELQNELNQNSNSMTRLNKFWKAQFESYFVKRLDKAFQQQEISKVNMNLTIEEILDDWIAELTMESNIVPDSITFIRSTIEQGLLALFNKQGFNITSTDNLLKVNYKKFVNAKRVKKSKRDRKHSETLNGLLTRVERTLEQGLQRGLSAELLAIGEAGRGGAISMGTGDIKKSILNAFSGRHDKVQQKGDVYSIEAYNTTIDLYDIAEDAYQSIQAGGEAGLKNLQNFLEQVIKDTEDIYIVEVNTKGYKSLRDLNIEKEGSFAARMNNLYAMRDYFPQKSIDQLIFLLNNTMDDCVASHHKDLLGDYFSAVFAAWMWDDYAEMFKMAEQQGVKRIRIFNSGGMYFSASQIMKRTLEDLQNEAGSKSFVYATITPPTFDPDQYYASLKKKPGYSVEGVPGGEERQNILEKRWDTMRDKVMKEGTVSIHIRQQQLTELLGKLLSFM